MFHFVLLLLDLLHILLYLSSENVRFLSSDICRDFPLKSTLASLCSSAFSFEYHSKSNQQPMCRTKSLPYISLFQ